MSGIKGKSGRKPRHLEESKILDGLYPQAVCVVKEILNDKKTASNTRLEAALAVIWKKTGKPHQSQDLRVTAIRLVSGDDYELAMRKVLEEDSKLIEQYGSGLTEIKGGSNNAINRGSKDGIPKEANEGEKV